jgi:DNA ligase 1
MTAFKPMLAASCDNLDALKFPLLATPKIDGIRCLIIDGVAMSRSLKPIPNRYIQKVIGHPKYNGLDGELIVGSTFQQATSGIMSEDGEPDFKYYVFDDFTNPAEAYELRCKRVAERVTMDNIPLVPLVGGTIRNREQLDAVTEFYLSRGHEGIMVRSAEGPYKHGRATFREGYLTKIKPFEDDEAKIIGFEEQMHNANEATTNALGRTERSSHKGNLVPKGTLGALVVEHPKFGKFNLGTGFDDALRREIWSKRPEYVLRVVKFRYQAIGTKDKPRIPTFLGFRHSHDS